VAEEEKKAAEEKAGGESSKPKPHHHKAKHADKDKKDGGVVKKIVATVFGTILTPVLIALLIKWGDPALWKSWFGGKEKDPPPITALPPRTGTIHLVGPNLGEHFYYAAFDPNSEKSVRHEASDSEAFQYKDRPDRIVVSPVKKNETTPDSAILATKEEFEDFTLVYKYRWLEKTWPVSSQDRARRASILLRAGEEGVWKDEYAWPECVTVFIGDGACGTIRLTSRPGSLTCKARVKERPGGTLEYLGREGDPISLETGVDPRLNNHTVPWANYVFRLGFPADYRLRANIPSRDRTIQAAVIGGSPAVAHPNLFADWAPLGWHPPGDPAISTVKPPYKPGEWNKIIIDCNKDVIRVSVNGTLVNEIYGLNLKKGKLGFTSQGAEYEIGQIDVEIKGPEKAEKEPTPVKDTKKSRTS
jgi:hypothetical protein